MRNHKYYVYILTNRPGGTLYIGVTNDLTRRLFEHAQGTASAFHGATTAHALSGLNITGMYPKLPCAKNA